MNIKEVAEKLKFRSYVMNLSYQTTYNYYFLKEEKHGYSFEDLKPHLFKVVKHGKSKQ